MKYRLTVFLSIVLCGCFALAASAQNPPTTISAETKPDVSSAAHDSSKKAVQSQDIEKDLNEALAIVQKNYGGTKTLDYNEMFKTSIDGMLHTLDPHSNYFDAKENEQFKTDQSSRYFGIGATIGDLSDPQGNVIATYIKATFDGAPANRAGLRYGDKILEVNGTSMAGKPFNEVRNFLRGPRGTVAKIVVERLGTGQHDTVEITRDAVPQPSISESYMIRPGIGYLAMRGGFNQTTYAEFVADIRDLKAQGMQQLILDLRDNGGGLVVQAYRVANSFLSAGQTVFTQKGRIEGVTERYDAENQTPDRSPVVILVNRNTASASEILAGAMQDHDRALLVGENTFGKGLVQNPYQLDYGSMLLLTIAKYETPAGRLIQRDYSNGELYSYYTEGGSLRNEDLPEKPRGPESKTDSGRAVYSGGGITPDVLVKPKLLSVESERNEKKLLDPIFAFALDLVAGRAKGFESYKVDKPIVFGHDIKPADFPVKEDLYQAFRKYAADKYKVPGVQTDSERPFVERLLRTELITAAYGSESSYQVFNQTDDQILRAIDLLPEAKQLAINALKSRTTADRQ